MKVSRKDAFYYEAVADGQTVARAVVAVRFDGVVLEHFYHDPNLWSDESEKEFLRYIFKSHAVPFYLQWRVVTDKFGIFLFQNGFVLVDGDTNLYMRPSKVEA